MTTRFIGCLHFGHKWMAAHRGFNDTFDHDETLIEVWNSHVNKRDLIYVLGDITMETNLFYGHLDRLKGNKIFVLGNHDLPKHVPELMQYGQTCAGMIDYKGYAITHCPIHPQEVQYYKANIHAHVHENSIDDPRYINVDAKLRNFIPLSLDELKELSDESITLQKRANFEKWITLREETKNEEGKLCYCGHTNRCDCANPNQTLFEESVKRGVLSPDDPKNGWKSSNE